MEWMKNPGRNARSVPCSGSPPEVGGSLQDPVSQESEGLEICPVSPISPREVRGTV